MTVRVLLFATYADAIGAPEIRLDVPPGSVVADVVERVRGLAGAFALPPAPMVAVNAAYARFDVAVADGDEVAIIPPVAGG
jgi:molybdopterin converting factor subunit 1